MKQLLEEIKFRYPETHALYQYAKRLEGALLRSILAEDSVEFEEVVDDFPTENEVDLEDETAADLAGMLGTEDIYTVYDGIDDGIDMSPMLGYDPIAERIF